MGIPREKMGLLFEKFSQANVSTTRMHGGTGLGLAISKQLVEMMGGSIGVISQEGKGSEFWFTVLMEKGKASGETVLFAAMKESSEIKRSAPITRRAPLRKNPCFCGGEAHILVAEDNRTNQQVARGILEKLGLKVHIVSNGKSAVEALEKASYDLVLMDCQMPGMDGYQATRHIRQMNSPVCDIPVIAMTGYAMTGDREKCLEAGMDDYVTKPISPASLMEVLGRWLQEKRSPSRKEISQELEITPRETDTEDPKPPIWNNEDLLDRLSGDEESVREVVSDFLEDTPQEIAALEAALASGEMVGAEKHVHSIKGTAACIGAEALQAVALGIERAARGGNPNALSESLPDLKREFARLKKALEESPFSP